MPVVKATPSKTLRHCTCIYCRGHRDWTFVVTDEPLGTSPDGYYVGYCTEDELRGPHDDLAQAIVRSSQLADLAEQERSEL